MKKKYQIYKELNNLFKSETDAARTNFWKRCKENNITGFAWFMLLFPILLVYGIYFGCIYGPYLIENWKTKRAAKQRIETCTPEEDINWGEDDFTE